MRRQELRLFSRAPWNAQKQQTDWEVDNCREQGAVQVAIRVLGDCRQPGHTPFWGNFRVGVRTQPQALRSLRLCCRVVLGRDSV